MKLQARLVAFCGGLQGRDGERVSTITRAHSSVVLSELCPRLGPNVVVCGKPAQNFTVFFECGGEFDGLAQFWFEGAFSLA